MKRFSKKLMIIVATMGISGCAQTSVSPNVCRSEPIAPPKCIAPKIVEMPIDFGATRVALTKAYIKKHYGKTVSDITIVPEIVVLHYTAIDSLKASYNTMKPEKLRGRKDIAKASALNVSAHFLVDKDGTIYRLMPENRMARHVIGLNYRAVGIENVAEDAAHLTPAQVEANAVLVRYLKCKYPTIRYLIGHHEYRRMEKTPLWMEKDKGYRTVKSDPGAAFMREVREKVKDLGLEEPPKE